MRKIIAGCLGIVLAVVCIVMLSLQPKVYFGATSEPPKSVENNEEFATVLQSLPNVSAYYNATKEDGQELELSDDFVPVTVTDVITKEVYRSYSNEGQYVDVNTVKDVVEYYGEDIMNATTTLYYIKDSVLYHIAGTITSGRHTEEMYYNAVDYSFGDRVQKGGKLVYDQNRTEIDGYLLITGGKVYLRYDKYVIEDVNYSVTYTGSGNSKTYGEREYPEQEEKGYDASQAVIDEINENWLGVWYASDHKLSEKDQKRYEQVQSGQVAPGQDYMLLQMEATIGNISKGITQDLVTISDSVTVMFNKIGNYIATYAPEDIAGKYEEIEDKSSFETCLDLYDNSCHSLAISWINPYSPSISYEIDNSSGGTHYNSKAVITISNIGNTGISLGKKPDKDIWDVAKPAIERYFEQSIKQGGEQ